MVRPRGVIETERGNWRVPEGTNALVDALKAAGPPAEAGEWTAGRVIAWAVLALADQVAGDETCSPAERALITERAAVLRETLRREADAKAERQERPV